jgi:predicted MFS family arabinose efflux permease
MTIVSPILGDIQQHFAGGGYDFWMKQIETVGTLFMVITGLGIGFLLKHFTKKTLLLVGDMIMLVFGFLPFLVGDYFWGIFFSRAVMGFGMGLIYPFAASFIIDLFQGADQKFMMGMRSTVGAIAGMIFATLTAQLSFNFGYKFSFLIPLILVPVVIIVKVFMVQDQIAYKSEPSQQIAEKEQRLRKTSWGYICGNIALMIFAYTYFTNIGIVATSPVEAGGGGFDTTVVGNVMTAFSLTMAVSGVLFKPVFLRLFHRQTPAVGVLLLAISLFVLYFSGQAMAMYFIGGILFGFGYQIYNGSFVLNLACTVTAKHVALAVSYFMAFNGIGQYLSSVFIPMVARGVLPGNLRADWLIGGVGLFVVAAAALIFIKKEKVFRPDDSI